AGMERARERPMLDTATVLALAEAIEPRLRCLILLGGFGGLRTGELLACNAGTSIRSTAPLWSCGKLMRSPVPDAYSHRPSPTPAAER
ncbi:MAG TPA: hypothetical protein VG244_13395, partial [Acidimicrobiales bacterium]|nr:hypothetical protein [Acidimicrobiales bacterium]